MAQLEPVPVQMIGSHGYVWEPKDVVTLRRQHRLVGCLIGGIAGFASQVEVSGVPLQLSLEEISLALQNSWVTLYTRHAPGLPAAHLSPAPPGTSSSQSPSQQQQQQQQPPAKRQRAEAEDVGSYDDHWKYYDGGGAEGGVQRSVPQAIGPEPTHGTLGGATVRPQAAAGADDDTGADLYDDYYAAYYSSDGQATGMPPAVPLQPPLAQDEPRPEQQQQQVPPWTEAVRSGAHYTIPTTAQEAAEVNGSAGHTAGDVAACSSSVNAALPALSEAQARRVAVFRDLHARGFTLTPGIKFGGDFLLYPGDPKLYHAQFVVRVLQEGAPLCPTLLKLWARGVHGARKHLVLAVVAAGALDAARRAGIGWHLGAVDMEDISYCTLARETGFVSSKAPGGGQGG